MLELPIVRLQVQRGPIKPGRAPWRAYTPAVLHAVAELAVTADGCVGIDPDGTRHLDVHNRTHPTTRDSRGRAGISIMATGDYLALRARYGPHVVDGIAGESVLVDHEPGLAGRAMPATMRVRHAVDRRDDHGGPGPDRTGPDSADVPGQDGTDLPLTGVHVAEPCVEFTRFCLRLPASDRVGDDVRAALIDLGGGARGYKMVAAAPGRIRLGDLLLIDG